MDSNRRGPRKRCDSETIKDLRSKVYYLRKHIRDTREVPGYVLYNNMIDNIVDFMGLCNMEGDCTTKDKTLYEFHVFISNKYGK